MAVIITVMILFQFHEGPKLNRITTVTVTTIPTKRPSHERLGVNMAEEEQLPHYQRLNRCELFQFPVSFQMQFKVIYGL